MTRDQEVTKAIRWFQRRITQLEEENRLLAQAHLDRAEPGPKPEPAPRPAPRPPSFSEAGHRRTTIDRCDNCGLSGQEFESRRRQGVISRCHAPEAVDDTATVPPCSICQTITPQIPPNHIHRLGRGAPDIPRGQTLSFVACNPCLAAIASWLRLQRLSDVPPWPAYGAHAHYTSTYCIHARHSDCRIQCKHCEAQCRCGCHQLGAR